MAHEHDSNEKVVFVGDSRVRKRDYSERTPPDYTAFPGKSEAFIPNFLLKEWMVGCVVLVGFLVLVDCGTGSARLSGGSDECGIHTDAGLVLPVPVSISEISLRFGRLYRTWAYSDCRGCLSSRLLLAPFLDTGKERRFYRRPIASSLMMVSLVAVAYLTWVSWHHYTGELEKNGVVPEHIEREIKAEEAVKKGLPRPIPGREKIPAMVAADDPAFTDTMTQAACIACHGAELEGGSGPALRGIGDVLSKEELVATITNGKGDMMPPFKDELTAEQIDQIATWLSKQKAEAAE